MLASTKGMPVCWGGGGDGWVGGGVRGVAGHMVSWSQRQQRHSVAIGATGRTERPRSAEHVAGAATCGSHMPFCSGGRPPLQSPSQPPGAPGRTSIAERALRPAANPCGGPTGRPAARGLQHRGVHAAAARCKVRPKPRVRPETAGRCSLQADGQASRRADHMGSRRTGRRPHTHTHTPTHGRPPHPLPPSGLSRGRSPGCPGA